MQVMSRFTAWRVTRQRERNIRRIRAAKLRLVNLLENTPRYWRAITIGSSGMIDIGSVTKAEAVKFIEDAGHTIAYIDVDESFIALGGSGDNSDPSIAA